MRGRGERKSGEVREKEGVEGEQMEGESEVESVSGERQKRVERM